MDYFYFARRGYIQAGIICSYEKVRPGCRGESTSRKQSYSGESKGQVFIEGAKTK